MKVCILTTSFPLRDGDLSGIFMLDQGKYLIKRGIKVNVVAPHHPGVPHDEDMNGIHVHRFRYFMPARFQRLCYGNGMPNNVKESLLAKIQLPFLLLIFALQAIRHARECDIIHAHWTPAGLAGLIAAKLLGKPIVLTMHHGTTRPLNTLEKVILERVDYVLCNSRFTLANVLKSSKPKKTKVIPPGVDVHKFQPYSEEIVDEHLVSKIPTDYPIIFTVGRLIELKGHKYLIEAFRSLTEDPLPRLVIGGDGPLRNELELCVKEYNLSDRVTFLGHVPTHLTPFYYSMADIYVQPSIIDNDGNTEGLGVTLVEAMACETPCIGSDVGGIPDIIVDGQNGLLVTPADPVQLANKISILLKNNDLRLQMGKQARDFVKENYSWQAKAEELAEIYSCLINNNNLQNKTPPS